MAEAGSLDFYPGDSTYTGRRALKPSSMYGRTAGGLWLPMLVASDGGIATKDGGAASTTVLGVSGARFTSADQHSAVASVTDAPTSGQKLVIDDLIVSVDTAMSVSFKEETSGTIFATFYMPANSVLPMTPRGRFKLATADKKLQVLTSVAGNIAVTALYHSEA